MVIAELRRWRLACPKSKLGLVFPTPTGGVVSHACILKDGFGPIQISAGVSQTEARVGADGKPVLDKSGKPRIDVKPKYGLHALRHAAAAMLIEQGFNPKRIQTILGHASIGLTYDVYGYLFASQEDDQAGMAAMESRLLGS